MVGMGDDGAAPATRSGRPHAVVLGGVAGVGKTTVGRIVASRLGWAFVDGDDFHGAASVAKMRQGIGLDDADRAAWLRALGSEIDRRRTAGQGVVVAASLLRAAYRRRVRKGRPGLAVAMLTLDRGRLEARLDARRGHFAGSDLLDSQFATLELGGPRPAAFVDAVVSADGDPDRVAERVLAALGLGDDG